MNPRIQELAEQAGGNANVLVLIRRHTYFNIEKFAELIVEECANVADENYIHRGSRTCGLAIRLHFGVEE